MATCRALAEVPNVTNVSENSKKYLLLFRVWYDGGFEVVVDGKLLCAHHRAKELLVGLTLIFTIIEDHHQFQYSDP